MAFAVGISPLLAGGLQYLVQGVMEMIMAEKANHKCWKTPDFEVRFREAMGREMTAQEREYFGLTEKSSSASGNASDDSARTQMDADQNNPPAGRSEFAWPTLRHITALGG